MEAARVKVAGGFFYGWWVLVGGFLVIALGSGAYFYGFSVLFKPIGDDFGWSRAVTAGAYSLATAVGGAVVLASGPLIDRFGPRWVMLVGIGLGGVGYILLGRVHGLLAFYLVFTVIIALGIYGGFHNPAEVAAANWFVRRRALTQGILSCAFAIGGAVFTPALGWLIAHHGWRTAVQLLGGIILVVGIPASLLMRHRPEQHGYLPDGARGSAQGLAHRNPRAASVPAEAEFGVREALGTRQFWMLSVAASLKFMGSGAVFVHNIPYLLDKGFDAQTAANILGLFALFSISGRLVFGYLGDRFSKRHLLALTMMLEAGGVLSLLLARNLWYISAFVLFYSLGMGTLSLLPSIRADYFGRRTFATLSGVAQAVTTVGAMLGPVLAGWVYDMTGSYGAAFLLFFATYCAAALLVFFSMPPLRQGVPPARHAC